MPVGQRIVFNPNTPEEQEAALKKATAKKEAEIQQRRANDVAAFGNEAAQIRQDRQNEFIKTAAARGGGGNQLVTQRFSDGSFNAIGRNNAAAKSGPTALALGLINIGGNTAAAIPGNEKTTFDRIAPVAQAKHNALNSQLLRPSLTASVTRGSQRGAPSQQIDGPAATNGVPSQALAGLEKQLLRRKPRG